jgi:hypothetical protein
MTYRRSVEGIRPSDRRRGAADAGGALFKPVRDGGDPRDHPDDGGRRPMRTGALARWVPDGRDPRDHPDDGGGVLIEPVPDGGHIIGAQRIVDDPV